MTSIAIIVGSTRPGRRGESIGRWVHTHARRRGDAEFDLIDLAEIKLPMLNESLPPSLGHYEHEHTKRWASLISRYDGYIFVTPEYNHSTSAALKNALDYAYAEWNNKAAGFVGYGSLGGIRAVEQLRVVCSELQIATVRAQVAVFLDQDFTVAGEFAPRDDTLAKLTDTLSQTVSWSRALQSVRREPLVAARSA